MRKSLVVWRRDAAPLLGIPAIHHPDTPAGTVCAVGPLPAEFFKLPMDVVNSTETSVNLDYLKIIPYIALQDQATQRVFVYKRVPPEDTTQSQGEWAIGIDCCLEIPFPVFRALEWIIACEVAEELELRSSLILYEEHLEVLAEALKDPTQVGFIYRNDTEVNIPRLGVVLILEVDAQLSDTLEDKNPELGEWLSLDELRQDIADRVIRLESWSEMLLDLLIESPRVVPLPP
jgi:predicted NUDIX family phosphoesterase